MPTWLYWMTLILVVVPGISFALCRVASRFMYCSELDTPTIAPEVPIKNKHRNGSTRFTSTGNGGISTSSSSSSISPNPTPRFAVIDLGTNNSPVAFNNAGSVVLQSGSYPSYTNSYWTNGAVAAPIPLTNVVGMNNSGVVVGTTGTNITLYSPSGPGLDPDYAPVTYTPASSWNLSGGVSQVGANPTHHVIPTGAGGEPANPLITSYSGEFGSVGGDITSTPVGITDGGITYGSMYEYFLFFDIDGPAVWGGCMATLNNNTPLNTLVVGTFGYGGDTVTGPVSQLTAVNASGQAVGVIEPTGYRDGSQYWVAYDGTEFHTLNGIPYYIASNYSIVGTDSTGTNTLLFTNGATTGVLLTNIAPGPINASNQIVNGGNLWQTNVVTQLSKVLGSTNWNSFYAANFNGAINDESMIVGWANYIPTNSTDPIPAGTHSTILLPCQLSLLNGDTNSADIDGKFFDGTRPTTVSALQNYTTAAFVSQTLASQDSYDILGPLPFGYGTSGEEGHVCVDSLILVAKVTSPSANVTYAWGRTVQNADVAITHTSTNTWYVNTIGIDLPPPVRVDTGSNAYYTVAPVSNVIAYSDAPGMNVVVNWDDSCGLNDFAYNKKHFTYFLTNSIGSAPPAVATLAVGEILVCKRIHTNTETIEDWTNVVNVLSTTNVPNCNAYTTNEIRQIVGPGDPIMFDPSVPVTQ
jgi:hypothetical protein